MRLKSNAVWHSLPGVEAVYQPIAAPSAVDARLNAGHNHRMVGRYTATPGVLPTWSAGTGWTFNGINQYLATNVIPNNNQTYTALVRYSNVVYSASYPSLLGIDKGTSYFNFVQFPDPPGISGRGYSNGYFATKSGTRFTSGVSAIAGNRAYLNGVDEGITISSAAGTWDIGIFIGCVNASGAPIGFSNYECQAAIFAFRRFTPAEVWLASRQMAYCEQNPDWNAWARRRNYFYAPSAAPGVVWPGVGRGGPVGGSPGIRGSAQ